MPKVRILPRPQVNFYSSFTLTICKNTSLLGGEVMLMQLNWQSNRLVSDRLWVQFPPSAPNDRNIGSIPLMITYCITQCLHFCGIRITVSIPVFQTGGEGSIPLSHTNYIYAISSVNQSNRLLSVWLKVRILYGVPNLQVQLNWQSDGLQNRWLEVRVLLPMPIKYCGVEKWSSHLPHKQKIVGSNPTSRNQFWRIQFNWQNSGPWLRPL